MNKTFKLTNKMQEEMANDLKDLAGQKDAHDSLGSRPGQVSPLDGNVDLRDSGSATTRSEDDPQMPEDPINPAYYRQHPSGVECIDIVEHMTYNLGTAFALIWRAGKKGNVIEDLQKAQWYLDREILRLSRGQK